MKILVSLLWSVLLCSRVSIHAMLGRRFHCAVPVLVITCVDGKEACRHLR